MRAYNVHNNLSEETMQYETMVEHAHGDDDALSAQVAANLWGKALFLLLHCYYNSLLFSLNA